MQVLVLASGSQYRAELLARLGIDFQTISPDIDESAKPGETPAVLAERLARQKTLAAADLLVKFSQSESNFVPDQPSRIIIGSDQVAASGNVTLGKPGTSARACAQLAQMSGRIVEFITALHMLDTKTGAVFSAMDVTRVSVRQLDAPGISRYVAADKPMDCAGSFKVESLGISLFESISTDDPTALIGLPMIKVCEGLRFFGLQVP